MPRQALRLMSARGSGSSVPLHPFGSTKADSETGGTSQYNSEARGLVDTSLACIIFACLLPLGSGPQLCHQDEFTSDCAAKRQRGKPTNQTSDEGS